MKEFRRSLLGGVFDLRVIIGVSGVFLSLLIHELFHIILHWGEVRSIAFLPDSHALVGITLSPSGDYDLIVEEAMAYTLTMVVLVMTTMLIYEVNDVRNSKSIAQLIAPGGNDSELDLREPMAANHLAALLGLKVVATEIQDT